MTEYREFKKIKNSDNFYCEICFFQDLPVIYEGRVIACSIDCIDEYWDQVQNHPDYAEARKIGVKIP